MTKKDLFKEGMASGAATVGEKTEQLSEEIIKGINEIKESQKELSDNDDFIFNEKNKEENEKLYGLFCENIELIDAMDVEAKQFILALLLFIAKEIGTNDLQKKYYEQLQIFFNVLDDQYQVSINHLDNINDNQFNKFIYRILIEFILLGEQNNEFLEVINNNINLSTKNTQAIVSEVKDKINALGEMVIINQYITEKTYEELFREKSVSKSSAIEEEIIFNNILSDDVHRVLSFWKQIFSFYDNDEAFKYSKMYSLKEKNELQAILEKNEILKEVDVHDVVAYSSFFIITNNSLIILEDNESFYAEEIFENVSVVNFDEIKGFSFEEENKNYLCEFYGTPTNIWGWDSSFEMELFLEMTDGKIEEVNISNFMFISSFSKDLRLKFLANLLDTIVNEKEFTEIDSLKFINYRYFNEKKPFSWNVYEKSLKLTLLSSIKNLSEYNMTMEIEGKEFDIGEFSDSPKSFHIDKEGLFLEDRFSCDFDALMKGTIGSSFGYKFFSFNNYSNLYFRKEDSIISLYTQKGVGLKATEEALNDTVKFLNSFIFLLNLSE
ncbi:hypothetical protein [Vagococcus carniphilus]|uniref:hypothetical protein n=1 Tax=Vagococcus carniphilus TaxID=218144 RepID=UPI00288C6842|nr:hypothetical protein [Vagococcus carniphilus]MDT2864241.1 hypothetical protein [Vagococcus carniphilus]